jgi:hypothetical protein
METRPIPKGWDAHPHKVNAVTELSEVLCQQARQYLPAGEQVDLIFVVPRSYRANFGYSPRFQPEQALLFTESGVLSIQEEDLDGELPAAVFVKPGELVSMTVSLILLYGKLEIIGAGADGQRLEIVVEYNTVRHYLLQPALQRFLALSAERTAPVGLDPICEQQARQNIAQMHLKYRNGLAIYALGPGEHLRGVAFQPAIFEKILLGLRRKVALPTLVALTDRHLILLGEERGKDQTEYGWVITYCPLAVVQGFDSIPWKQYQRFRILLQKDQVEAQHAVILADAAAQRVIELCQQAEFARK